MTNCTSFMLLLKSEINSFNKTRLFDEFTDVVVDDAPRVLEKAVQKGVIAIGLLFPWNRAYANNGFTLLNSLNDILNYILKGRSDDPQE